MQEKHGIELNKQINVEPKTEHSSKNPYIDHQHQVFRRQYSTNLSDTRNLSFLLFILVLFQVLFSFTNTSCATNFMITTDQKEKDDFSTCSYKDDISDGDSMDIGVGVDQNSLKVFQ